MREPCKLEWSAQRILDILMPNALIWRLKNHSIKFVVANWWPEHHLSHVASIWGDGWYWGEGHAHRSWTKIRAPKSAKIRRSWNEGFLCFLARSFLSLLFIQERSLRGFGCSHVLIAYKPVKAAKLQVLRIERAIAIIAKLREEVVDILRVCK